MEKEDILKVSNKGLIVGLILVALMGISYFVGSYISKKQEKDVVAYQTLFDETDVPEKYVSLEFNSFPYLFAEKTTDNTKEKYYIVFDQDNIMYIIRLNDKTYDKIEKMYDDLGDKAKEKFKYEIEGTTKSIPYDMKKLAIEAYNEEVDEKFLTYTNFEDYFGKTYLDGAVTPASQTWIIVVLVDVFFGIFAFINICNFITEKRKLKKAFDKYGEEVLKNALMSKDSDEFKTSKIYFTDKYVISNATGIEVVPYEDIYWAYKMTRKQNGFTVAKSLLAYKKNKKCVVIASNFDDKTLEEILEKLYKKNKNILIGYTKENQKAYKALPKIKE